MIPVFHRASRTKNMKKLNFHSLSGEHHKNRIKANEFEFMRLWYTSCQIASGVDLSTWRFISLPFLGVSQRGETTGFRFTIFHRKQQKDGERKEGITRHGPIDLLLHGL